MESVIKNRYSKAYVEILEIIKLMGEEYKEKIPAKLLEVFEKNKDNNYEYSIDIKTGLAEQEFMQETLGLLGMIELEYWTTLEEKQILKETLRKNEDEHQKQLQEKYNVDNMFKNKIQSTTEKENESVKVLKKYEENIFRRFLNKVKSIFFKM